MQITLIHTNDVHSSLDTWPRTASTVKAALAQAAAAGRPALYLDAGDFMDMSELTCYGTKGEVAPALLGALGCAAFSPGNNEIWRTAADGMNTRSPFPWLCANLRTKDGAPFAGLQPWSMAIAGPVKVGMIGMTAPYPGVAATMGLHYSDRDETIRQYAQAARAAGADLIVLLSHMGIWADREVAAAGLGVDLIIGGHSHDLLPAPEWVAGVPIVQAGELGQHVGVLTFDADDHTAEWRTIPTVAAAPDPEAQALVSRLQRKAGAALDEVVTILPRPLPHAALCSQLAEALRKRAAAEIGLVVGVAALKEFPAGPVTRRQIVESMPGLFNPALLEVTGGGLLALLEEAQDPAIYREPSGAAGLRPKADLPVGRLYAAGLTYTAARRGVDNLRINGEPVVWERIYRVGALSTMASPKTGYPAFAGCRLVQNFIPELLREIAESHLRDLDTQGGVW
jgi:2',3'-cyclic-nucleotide 2'-phosphodiesterase (5'-nucleotidase family)